MDKCIMAAGFGRGDITPALGVRLGGYGIKERPAEEVLDNLHSTAMVLERGSLRVAVVNIDWICVEEDVVARLRRAISESTGIPLENITISTTHTHSAPNTLNFWGWGELEDEYVEGAIPAIVGSVTAALENLKPAEVGFATCPSLVGVNRRGIKENGTMGFDADTIGSFDPTMTVAHFKSGDETLGVLVHYGAHGTAMGCNRMVSRDWCGVMKDRIEPQISAPVLFLNGAIGDVGPRTSCIIGGGASLSAGTGDGVHAVREVGYRAAADAIEALLSIREWRDDLHLAVTREEIFLPYAPLTELAIARLEKEKWDERKDEWGKPMLEYMHNCAVIEAHQSPILPGRKFPQVITSLGPLVIVPMPGEMFSGISLRIRKGSPFQYTLCCSVTNGSLSYFPTRESRHRGGYETWVGKATSAYLLADDIDDHLVMENLRMLRKAFGKNESC